MIPGNNKQPETRPDNVPAITELLALNDDIEFEPEQLEVVLSRADLD